jgi:tetratricopeptide (TPR) repeat protein
MRKILIFLSFITIFTACADKKKQAAIDDIKASELSLTKDLTQIDPKAAAALIQQYDNFIAAYPKDTTSASMIFKAADLSRGTGAFGKAIKYWGDLGEFFPNYSKTADAALLQAFTFENDLGDKEQAKHYYQKFLEKYPNHAFANDAKKALEQIDIPIEQLIKKFEAQNKAEIGNK